jgi:hypothetical protein
MPVNFNYHDSSEAERLHSVMPGCPVGDLFGHREWQERILEWEQEEQLRRTIAEGEAAKAIGQLLRNRYGVRHSRPEDFAADYIMYVEPAMN